MKMSKVSDVYEELTERSHFYFNTCLCRRENDFESYRYVKIDNKISQKDSV